MKKKKGSAEKPLKKTSTSRALSVAPCSALPPPSDGVEHIVYYRDPRIPLQRKYAVTSHKTIEDLERLWGDYDPGIIVETVTSHSTFQFLKPNAKAQTRAED